MPVQSDGCGEMVSLPPARLRQQLAQAAKQAALQPGFGNSMVYLVFNIQYPRFGDKPKCMSALVGAVVVTGPGLQASTIVLVALPVF